MSALSDPVSAEAPLLDALTPERWARANRELLAKLLSELAFEEVLPAPLGDPDADGWVAACLPLGGRELHYRARPRIMGDFRVDPASLRCLDGGAEVALPDVADVVAVAAPAFGTSPETTAGGILELANTLLSDAWQLASGRPVAELADAPAIELEGEMRGHPWIVANKGRLGFDAADLAAHAPEARRPVELEWLAAAPGVAQARGLPNGEVVAAQVGEEAFAGLRERAAAGGLDPDEAVFLPVHPWQWRTKVVPLHAGELARGELVRLGGAGRTYLPQQSIRTFVDVDDATRRYVKLPISILNTSVFRGIPSARALAAPALSAWFAGVVAGDAFLQETGVVLLGEVASVTVPHRAFAAVEGVPYQHTEMLGAIWRDPVAPQLREGERAITLAALLHRDPDGASLAAELVRRSGLDAATWVRRLHEATLPPLVHVLYRYGAAFSPHAQNCMVVLRDDVPVRLVVKDFVDDATVAVEALPELAALPDEVRRALDKGVEAHMLVQWLQAGLFVCVHRYVSAVFEEDLGLPERAFWDAARGVLDAYQERFATELGDRFELFDLDAPAFVKLCLNRVRLLEIGYADRGERPTASAVGWIDNPLAL